MPELPGSLRSRRSFPFVGRAARARDAATRCSRAPTARAGRVALLGGEAGSGKSRLVREFAHEAADEGVLVLYGACDAVVRTPYRPFAEALDQLVRGTDPDDAAAAISARRAASSPACFPTWPRASAGCRRRSAPTPTPSAIACTRR